MDVFTRWIKIYDRNKRFIFNFQYTGFPLKTSNTLTGARNTVSEGTSYSYSEELSGSISFHDFLLLKQLFCLMKYVYKSLLKLKIFRSFQLLPCINTEFVLEKKNPLDGQKVEPWSIASHTGRIKCSQLGAVIIVEFKKNPLWQSLPSPSWTDKTNGPVGNQHSGI